MQCFREIQAGWDWREEIVGSVCALDQLDDLLSFYDRENKLLMGCWEVKWGTGAGLDKRRV